MTLMAVHILQQDYECCGTMAVPATDWQIRCIEAQKALQTCKQTVKLQSLKSRQLIAAVKQKLEEKDVELTMVKVDLVRDGEKNCDGPFNFRFGLLTMTSFNPCANSCSSFKGPCQRNSLKSKS